MLKISKMLSAGSRVFALNGLKQSSVLRGSAVRAFGSSNSEESYTEKQAKLGRPVSPHVTTYKFPMVALSSIANRITGVTLSVGVTAVGGLALVGTDVAGLMTTIGNLWILGPVAKAAVTFPLAYHYVGGVRHAMWDRNPEMLYNDQVEKSSYAVFGIAGALTLGAMMI